MADKTENRKISMFQSPRKVISSVSYSLNVPNFFILPEYDGTSFELDSPSFEFVNTTWHFRFESREKEETMTGDSIKLFSVQMIRLNLEETRQRIFYEIALLGVDDEICVDYGDVCVFGDEEEEIDLLILSNEGLPNDRRDTLTLIVHLICIESVDVDVDQVSDKGKLRYKIDMGTRLIEFSIHFSFIILRDFNFNLIN